MMRKSRSSGTATPRRNEASAVAAGFNTAPLRHRGDPESTPLNASIYGGQDSKPPPPYSSRTNGDGVHASIAAVAGGPLPQSNASTVSVAGSNDRGDDGSANGRQRRFPQIMPPMVTGIKMGSEFKSNITNDQLQNYSISDFD
jgi:hypothetical protein